MQRIIFCLSLALICSLPCSADYRPLKLFQMILSADKILEAQILRVEKDFFYVTSTTQDEKSKNLFKIKRFINWSCAARYADYKEGQKAVFFLKKTKGYYSILSAGGEGEIPVINDSVIIPFACLAYPSGWMIGNGVRSDSMIRNYHRIGKLSFTGLKVPREELISSVKRLKTMLGSGFNSLQCSDFNKIQDQQAMLTENRDRLFYLVIKDLYSRRHYYCNQLNR